MVLAPFSQQFLGDQIKVSLLMQVRTTLPELLRQSLKNVSLEKAEWVDALSR